MIPVTFTFNGNEYKGLLQPVTGSGGVYHLMIDGYYYGRLRYTDKWVLDTNKKSRGMEVLAEYLGKVTRKQRRGGSA